jgi:hypothetical protein
VPTGLPSLSMLIDPSEPQREPRRSLRVPGLSRSNVPWLVALALFVAGILAPGLIALGLIYLSLLVAGWRATSASGYLRGLREWRQ